MYRYGYDDVDVHVEEGTERVPDDGRFHLVVRGQVVDSEGNLKRALGRLQQLRNNPPSDEEIAAGEDRRAKMRAGEMASRHLSQSTAEKASQFGRKGKRA